MREAVTPLRQFTESAFGRSSDYDSDTVFPRISLTKNEHHGCRWRDTCTALVISATGAGIKEGDRDY